MSAFEPFLQYFATGSDHDTASCQDYEGYKVVEFLLEEIQIIDLFTHLSYNHIGFLNTRLQL